MNRVESGRLRGGKFAKWGARENPSNLEHADRVQKGNRSGSLCRGYRAVYLLALAGLVAVGSASLMAVVEGAAVAWVAPGCTALFAIVAALGLRQLEFLRYRHLPGPRPEFFLGNLPDLLASDHLGRDQALIALHRCFGPVVRLHLGLGSRPFVSVAYPSSAVRGDVDSNRSADRTVMGDSLMGACAGTRHSEARTALSPHFRPAIVSTEASRIAAVHQTYLDAWAEGNTRHGSLLADIHQWSAESLGIYLAGSCWTGVDFSNYFKALAEIENEISIRAFHPPFVRWLHWRRSFRARRAMRYLRDLSNAILRRAASRSAPQCTFHHTAGVVGTLVALSSRWDKGRVADELISLMAGGTDAMSYTLAQVLELLARHPHVAARAREAADTHIPTATQPVHPYIRAIFYETMRLHPPVPFSSKRIECPTIDDHGTHLPAGTNLMWMKTAIGRNPELFERPEEFDPERFLDGKRFNVGMIRKTMPFGAGVRSCVGGQLAEMACGTFVSAIVAELDLEPTEGINVEYHATIAVTPSAVPVRLSRRRTPVEVRVSA